MSRSRFESGRRLHHEGVMKLVAITGSEARGTRKVRAGSSPAPFTAALVV